MGFLDVFLRRGEIVVLASLLILSGVSTGLAEGYKDPAVPLDQRVEDLLSKMTIEEKTGQLMQGLFDVGMEKNIESFFPAIREGRVSSYILMLEDAKYRNAMQKVAVEESRLGIPLIFGADVIHGHRTVFPIPLGLGATWNPALMEKAQTVAAKEARSMGLNWSFAPMCDLARDARWGRVAETTGEDPYLNSLFVAAAVKGFQGDNPAAPGRVVSCLKHFAGYGASVGGRDYNHTEISDFIFRNFHLPPFHAGVKAGALTVMSAFNANDGVPATASHWLLTDVLRTDWGFPGFVVSDWEGVKETINWGYVPDEDAAVRASLTAGNDMEMLSKLYNSIPTQVADGRLPIAVVDEAVRRVLRVKFKAGLFENPYTDEGAYAATILAPDSLALAREAVAKSCVLLKNQGALPISPLVKKIALIGPFADESREMLGCWISQGKQKDVVTLAGALKARLPKDTQLQVVQGCDINGNQPRTKTLTDGMVVVDKSVPMPMGLFDLPGAVQAAGNADLVIMTIGEPWSWTGENASRGKIVLTGRQQELFDTVIAVGKPVIVVLFSGRPLALPDVFDNAAAVLAAWQPGVQAGPGIADILLGDANPSGRLTISWPEDTGQLPLYYNRYNTGRPDKGFVDYRDMSREPRFPFGYGLSYTQFEYGKLQIVPGAYNRPGWVKTTVKNVGRREGTETAQFYIRQMACPEGARPAQELRGFQQVSLKPGESKDVSFELSEETLGYVGRDGKWRCDAGEFRLWISKQANDGDPVVYKRP